MGGLTDELREFLGAHRVGVLATSAADGRPRQSLVYYAREGERLLVSTESKRLKARDVRRSGWASLCVMGHEQPYPSAVFSGSAEILTTDIGRPTALVMQRIANLPEKRHPFHLGPWRKGVDPSLLSDSLQHRDRLIMRCGKQR
jgi:PPOX class probable F420-dependent enzyme